MRCQYEQLFVGFQDLLQADLQKTFGLFTDKVSEQKLIPCLGHLKGGQTSKVHGQATPLPS